MVVGTCRCVSGPRDRWCGVSFFGNLVCGRRHACHLAWPFSGSLLRHNYTHYVTNFDSVNVGDFAFVYGIKSLRRYTKENGLSCYFPCWIIRHVDSYGSEPVSSMSRSWHEAVLRGLHEEQRISERDLLRSEQARSSRSNTTFTRLCGDATPKLPQLSLNCWLAGGEERHPIGLVVSCDLTPSVNIDSP